MDLQDLLCAPRELLTQHLRLESPRADHAKAVLESVNVSLPGLRFVEWAQQAVDGVWADAFSQRGAQFVEKGEALIFYVFDRNDGAFVGIVDLHAFDLDLRCCQIGYVGDARRTGRGLMREAALAVIDLGFALGFGRVEAWCDVRNARSIRFAECLGMQRETVRRSVERDAQGQLCDQLVLSRVRPGAAPTR
jgi:RimJ/RimL family protein N-acetyltransferase